MATEDANNFRGAVKITYKISGTLCCWFDLQAQKPKQVSVLN